MGQSVLSVNIGGVSRSKTITRTGTTWTHNETPAAGHVGAMTTRTDDDTAVFTFGADPGLTTGTVDVAWVENGINKHRWQMDVSSYSNSGTHTVTVDGGAGDAFPTLPAVVQTYTDLVIDGTTNTNVTSAAHPFTSDDVGLVLIVTAGTGFTAQAYKIESVTSAGVATLSAAVGTVASTGGEATSRTMDTAFGVRTSVTFAFSGDALKTLSMYSEPPTGETESRACVDFLSSVPATIKACDLNDDEPFVWNNNSAIDNPLAGGTVATIGISSLSEQAPTVYIELIYDASP